MGYEKEWGADTFIIPVALPLKEQLQWKSKKTMTDILALLPKGIIENKKDCLKDETSAFVVKAGVVQAMEKEELYRPYHTYWKNKKRAGLPKPWFHRT